VPPPELAALTAPDGRAGSAGEPAAHGGGYRAALLAACLLALLLRLGTFPDVFVGGTPLVGGTDGYYHLRRALLTLENWPRVPQHDAFLGPPARGLIAWPPLFDFTLATLAKLYPAEPIAALEAVGVRLPVLLGVAQVLLAAGLARRLMGRPAAICTAFLVAVLPAAVRYTLLGALDHDPAVEVLAMVALLPLAGALSSPRGRPWAAVPLVAGALAALPLTWGGSELHLGLVGLAVLGAVLGGGWRRVAPAAAILAIAAALAVVVVSPFAAASPWNERDGEAFAGLSWLHVAVLACLGLGAVVVAWVGRASLSRRARVAVLVAGGAQALVLVVLLPTVLAPLVAGLRYAGREDAFLASAAESRPLLRLLGPFDVRPALVRLSALPLLLPLFLRGRWRTRESSAWGFVAAWFAGALVLALLQARYAHAAVLPLAVLAGMAWQNLHSRAKRLLWLAALLPCFPAFLPVPGFEGLRIYRRTNDLVSSGMAEVVVYLARTSPPPAAWLDPDGEAGGAVLAPWSYGHWIHWLGRRATVANPLGPYGQTGFRDAARFWLLDDPGAVLELLKRHQVRWVVAPTSPDPPWSLAALAGDDPSPWLAETPGASDRLGRGMGARLASSRELPWLRQVYCTGASRLRADGSLEPLLRVYELVSEAAPGLESRPRPPCGTMVVPAEVSGTDPELD
jgi:asparagine N-glycosylation enzyme membrane subunit Stt3